MIGVLTKGKIAIALIKLQVTFVESQKRTHSACAEQCRAGGQATELIERKSLKLILTGPKPGA